MLLKITMTLDIMKKMTVASTFLNILSQDAKWILIFQGPMTMTAEIFEICFIY